MAIADGDAAPERAGAVASFPYDRATVERFRAAFPRARWRDDLGAWFVPGVMAARRVDRWKASQFAGDFAIADARGRDAFAFEPIASPYLEAGDDLLVRTPYSKTVVEELRLIPFAGWDGELRAWRIPFRSYEELARHWPAIEAAARRSEPAERRRRKLEREASGAGAEDKERQAEYRRNRLPVALGALPPMGRPVMSVRGAVVLVEITGELVDAAVLERFYPAARPADDDLVWALWRRPTLEELVETRPSRQPAGVDEVARGWWHATLEDLRVERRKARSRAG